MSDQGLPSVAERASALPGLIDVSNKADRVSLTLESAEDVEEKRARIEREASEARHAHVRDLVVLVALILGLFGLGGVFTFAVTSSGFPLELREKALTALVALGTGALGYVAGTRVSKS